VPLCYAKCGQEDVESSVLQGLQSLRDSLVEVGPHIFRGSLILSFYVTREHKALFGFISNQEKSIFERWKIPILINEKPIPRGLDETSEFERNRIIESSRKLVVERMMNIFEVECIQNYVYCRLLF
jgi:hypothetical protein